MKRRLRLHAIAFVLTLLGLPACGQSVAGTSLLGNATAGPKAQSSSTSALGAPMGLSRPNKGIKRDYLFVASTKAVDVYSQEGRLLHTVSGTNVPAAIAVDKQGQLYVANSAANSVTIYSNKGGTLVQTLSQGISKPHGLAVDSRGTLYVANKSSITVYKGARLRRSSKLQIDAQALAVDAADDVYFRTVANGVPEVLVYSSGGKRIKATISRGVTARGPLAVDSEGTLYVGNRATSSGCTSSNVTEYSAGRTSPSLTIQDGICDPTSIAITDDYGMLVANYGNNSVSVYSSLSEYPISYLEEGVDQPVSLGLDNRGTVYVRNQSTVTVYEGGDLGATIQVDANAFALLVGLEP
jgi:hypothetical protein